MESVGLVKIGLKVIFSREKNLFNTKVIVLLPNVLIVASHMFLFLDCRKNWNLFHLPMILISSFLIKKLIF